MQIGRNEIFYQVFGQGSPLVLIHGGGADHRMWREQVDYFKKEYKVVVYDIRGHGRSDFEENDRPDINDLEILADELGLGKINLAGLSLGAILALDFALANPARVEKLILLSPGLIGAQEKEPTYMDAMIAIGSAIREGNIEKAADVVHQFTFVGQRESEPAGVDSWTSYLRDATRKYFESGHFKRIPQLKETAPIARLGEISCPTLILFGREDLPYMTRNVKELEGGIPDSQSIGFSNAAHLVNVEAPDAVNQAMADFLAQ